MLTKDLMNKNVITINKKDSIENAINLMEKNDIGMVIIINDNKDILGVLTDRDILIRTFKRNLPFTESVDSIMTTPAITIDGEKTIEHAVSVMADFQIKRLVVTLNNELAGVISISNIVLNNDSRYLINKLIYEISIPNPQKEKPLKYLKVEDFPL